MKPVLVSACLLGFACRHDGRAKKDDRVLGLVGEVVPVCPEAAAGLGIPRKAFAFEGERLVAADGTDATEAFSAGAQIALEGARRWAAERAILKARSPSCGVRTVYTRQDDGSEVVTKGAGVTARVLAQEGLKLSTEEDL